MACRSCRAGWSGAGMPPTSRSGKAERMSAAVDSSSGAEAAAAPAVEPAAAAAVTDISAAACAGATLVLRELLDAVACSLQVRAASRSSLAHTSCTVTVLLPCARKDTQQQLVKHRLSTLTRPYTVLPRQDPCLLSLSISSQQDVVLTSTPCSSSRTTPHLLPCSPTPPCPAQLLPALAHSLQFCFNLSCFESIPPHPPPAALGTRRASGSTASAAVNTAALAAWAPAANRQHRVVGCNSLS